jgi:antitoxin ParD1/3/4
MPYHPIMPTEPTTVTMNVSLPGPLKQFVDGKVSSGVYGSASEFIREAIREKLLREDQRQQAKDALTTKLLQGLGSGKPIPFSDALFRRKKNALIRRAARKNKNA